MVASVAEQARSELQRRYAKEELQRRRLLHFFIGAWEELEPGTLLALNWHVELLCEYLEAVYYGEIGKLLVNIAPRHLKSRILSVAFPCWTWLHRPHERFLCLSYAGSLAVDHNYDRRRLIQSDWYQNLAGGLPLSFGKNRLTEFSNAAQGEMIARGFDGAVGGKGGSYIIVDDPNDPEKPESAATLENTQKKFRGYTTTRKNDPNAPIVVVQQRTNTQDVSAWIQENDKEYEHLCLPTIAEQRTVITFPRSGRQIVREADSVLHGDRYSRVQLDKDKLAMGSAAFSARHQQRPVPIEGMMVSASQFKTYSVAPAGAQIVLSLDTASKPKRTNKPWAAGIWAISEPFAYLLYVFVKRMTYPEGKRVIYSLAQQWQPNAILIEDKSTGQSLIQDFSADSQPYSVIPITPEADKSTRFSTESPAIEAGRIWLPYDAPWLAEYLLEITTFPFSAEADQVDMTSQFLKWWRLQSSVQVVPSSHAKPVQTVYPRSSVGAARKLFG